MIHDIRILPFDSKIKIINISPILMEIIYEPII